MEEEEKASQSHLSLFFRYGGKVLEGGLGKAPVQYSTVGGLARSERGRKVDRRHRLR